MFQAIHTERLTLREFTLEDAPFIQVLLNTDTWIKYIGDRGIDSEKKAKEYIQTGLIDSYRRDGLGFYHVSVSETGTDIGMCGLVNRDGLDYPDIGFALLPSQEGKGYAWEMARATLDYARDQLKLKRIEAITIEENKRSISLLEKLGLSYERNISIPKDPDDLMLFAIEF